MLLCQSASDGFLGAGLAHRTGDADHGRADLVELVGADVLQGLERVRHLYVGHTVRNGAGRAVGDDASRMVGDGVRNEVVAIYVFTLEGDEQVAALHLARVDDCALEGHLALMPAGQLPATSPQHVGQREGHQRLPDGAGFAEGAGFAGTGVGVAADLASATGSVGSILKCTNSCLAISRQTGAATSDPNGTSCGSSILTSIANFGLSAGAKPIREAMNFPSA